MAHHLVGTLLGGGGVGGGGVGLLRARGPLHRLGLGGGAGLRQQEQAGGQEQEEEDGVGVERQGPHNVPGWGGGRWWWWWWGGRRDRVEGVPPGRGASSGCFFLTDGIQV